MPVIQQLSPEEMQTLQKGGMVCIAGMVLGGPFEIRLVYKTPWDPKGARKKKVRESKKQVGGFTATCGHPKCGWKKGGYETLAQSSYGLAMHRRRAHEGMKAPNQK